MLHVEVVNIMYLYLFGSQFIDEFLVGIRVNDSRLINLANDINNVYSQNYVEQTNILNTEIINTYFNLKIVQTDFVPMNGNILVI